MQIDRALAMTAAIAPPAAGSHIPGLTQLEAFPELLWPAVSLAHALVSQLKEY